VNQNCTAPFPGKFGKRLGIVTLSLGIEQCQPVIGQLLQHPVVAAVARRLTGDVDQGGQIKRLKIFGR